jgi:signal transduction histidine kinase
MTALNMAQIEAFGNLFTSGLGSAAEAGVAITAMVLLIVFALVTAAITWWVMGDRRETRKLKAEQEKAEREAKERREIAEREMLSKEREHFKEAAQTSDRINQLLMDRLEEQTKVQEKTAKVIATQAEGMDKLVTSIDGNSSALREVQQELKTVQRDLKTLTETVSGVRGLSDADRKRIDALTSKFDQLLKKFEEGVQNEEQSDPKPDDTPSPANVAGDAVYGTDADGGGHA